MLTAGGDRTVAPADNPGAAIIVLQIKRANFQLIAGCQLAAVGAVLIVLAVLNPALLQDLLDIQTVAGGDRLLCRLLLLAWVLIDQCRQPLPVYRL